jgi:hypothetical protein
VLYGAFRICTQALQAGHVGFSHGFSVELHSKYSPWWFSRAVLALILGKTTNATVPNQERTKTMTINSQFPIGVMIMRHGEKPGDPNNDKDGGPNL